jgi:hypothetical protein
MFSRGIAAAVMFLALGQEVSAGDKGNILQRTSCAVVRYYVAKYSEPVAAAWARSKGPTDAELENARRCLPRSAAQSASISR